MLPDINTWPEMHDVRGTVENLVAGRSAPLLPPGVVVIATGTVLTVMGFAAESMVAGFALEAYLPGALLSCFLLGAVAALGNFLLTGLIVHGHWRWYGPQRPLGILLCLLCAFDWVLLLTSDVEDRVLWLQVGGTVLVVLAVTLVRSRRYRAFICYRYLLAKRWAERQRAEAR